MRAESNNSNSNARARARKHRFESSYTIDRLSYPAALLDQQGNIVYAGPGFPEPADKSSEWIGQPIFGWLKDDQHALVTAFLDEARTPDANSRGTSKTHHGPKLDVGFCDIESPHTPGYSFRLVPLVDTGDGVGTLVILLPATVLDVSAPGVAEHEMQLRHRMTAVLEVSRAVSSTLERDVILQRIVDHVREVVVVPEVVLFLVADDGETLEPVVAKVDEFYDEVMSVRLKRGEGIVGHVAETSKAEIVNQAERDPRSIQVPGTPFETSSLLCCPLIIKEELAGILVLTRFGEERFAEDDLEVVTIFATHCSVAIENSRLYEDLRSTVEELRATQNQLIQSAKLNALGEMAGGVAHDFNNVLTAILGRTQLLLRWAEDAELRETLQIIEQTALDGAHTVRRIQEFTRLRQDHGFEQVDINQVLLDVVELTRPSWEYPTKNKRIRVSAEIELHSTRPVRGRAAELREVFTNLILNALDAMPEGGTIRITSEDKGDLVVARISDSGIGMDDATQNHIFDPFFTTKSDKGTGLGLSVAYGIVTRHDGEINVESKVGDGTTFVLQLPASGDEVSPPVKQPEKQEARAMRVLCVDDERIVLEVMAELLEALGQDVDQALGGRKGIDAALEIRPDAVFTDLGMPEVNGWEVAESVKEKSPDTAVVLVTGWGVQIDAEEAKTRGVDFILPKPYTLEEVKRLLEAISERRSKAA